MKKKKKNNPKNSGHFVPQQRLRAAHALHSDQNDLVSDLLLLTGQISTTAHITICHLVVITHILDGIDIIRL